MFHIRLKQAREAKNLTQRDLAALLGVSAGRVGNYENGNRRPDFDMLIKISDILNCTTDFLLGRVSSPDVEIRKAPPNDEGATEYAIKKDAPDLTVEDIRKLKAFLEERERENRGC